SRKRTLPSGWNDSFRTLWRCPANSSKHFAEQPLDSLNPFDRVIACRQQFGWRLGTEHGHGSSVDSPVTQMFYRFEHVNVRPIVAHAKDCLYAKALGE